MLSVSQLEVSIHGWLAADARRVSYRLSGLILPWERSSPKLDEENSCHLGFLKGMRNTRTGDWFLGI